MNYKQAIEAFVAKNRQVLSFLFRHRVKLDDREFGIVLGHLSFAATEDGFHANGGIDREKVLEQIRQQPFAKRNLEVQMKALAWWEKGQTFNKPIPEAVESLPDYSAPVLVELKETHLRQYRESFNGLADSVNGLTNKVYDLARFLVKNAASLDNQDVKREYSVRLASIRSSLQSCEYRAKSGVVWASRVGIPMEKVARGISCLCRHRQALQGYGGEEFHGPENQAESRSDAERPFECCSQRRKAKTACKTQTTTGPSCGSGHLAGRTEWTILPIRILIV